MVSARILPPLCAIATLSCADYDCDALAACDIRTSDCQKHVMKVVACLRGDAPARLRVDVKDADAFIDEQVRELDDDPISIDTTDWYRALGQIDLMPRTVEPEELVAADWQDVAAFYSSNTKRVTVLDRGDVLDDGSSLLVLAHELVHVLQDEAGQLAFDSNHDLELAKRALVEGEATLYQDLAHVQGLGFQSSEVDWSRVAAPFQRDAWQRAVEEPNAYQLSGSHFAYAFGLGYVGAAFQRGGSREVARAVATAPDSTRAVVAGYGAAAPEGSWVEDMSDVAIPVLPESSYELVHVERGGAFLFALLLQRRLDADRPVPALDLEDNGWRGDSLSVHRDPEGQLRLFWRVRFASREHAERMLNALDDREAWRVRVELRERDLILAAAWPEAEDPSTLPLYDAWGPAPEKAADSEDSAAIRCIR